MVNTKKRLESLDILRGFDLFLLVGLQPVLMSLGQVWDNPLYHQFLHQFDHEVWEGFRLWDLIMPLFLFMTGITIPFSLDSKIGNTGRVVYVHLLRRFVILWLIGMLMQGNLMGLELNKLKLYSNTLQAIAIGYLLTAVLYLNFRVRTLQWIAAALLILYSIPFIIDGDYSPQNNFAIRVDKAVLRYFMDGAYWDTSTTWKFSPWYDYTWIWSSLTFTVTVMMGCFAGKIIKDQKDSRPNRIVQKLFIIGISCVVIGSLLGLYLPIIKRIWTSTMVLYSGGICFILMALFYYIIDVRGWSKPFIWFKVYGMNSILAYVMGEYLNFRGIIHSFTYGLEGMFPPYKHLILTSGNFLLIFLILCFLYKNRIFIKV